MSVCFIHSCTLSLRGSAILDHLIEKLRQENLLSSFEYIFINNLGEALPHDKYPEKNIKIINSSRDTDMFENATLRLIHFFSQTHPDYKILYLHTKGVGYDVNHPFYQGICDWIDFMLYCLVNKSSNCLKLLDYVDVVGCDYRNQLFFENPNHYSGNFWWATSDYIKKLDVAILKGKYDAEFWLFTNKPAFINIHTCPYGHYENAYPQKHYEQIVEFSLTAQEEIVSSIKNLKIMYGNQDVTYDKDFKIMYGNQDVTQICHDKLISDGHLRIPAGDKERNEIFGDPLPGKVKVITIGRYIYSYKTDICFRV